MVDLDDVVIVLEILEKQRHMLDIVLIRERDVGRRDLVGVGGRDRVSLSLESLAYSLKVVRLCRDLSK